MRAARLALFIGILAFITGVPESLWAGEVTGGTSPSPASGPGVSGAPSNGEALFTGITPLQNGGPPCMACHNISGIPFPGGGTVGPDLTGVVSKFGAAIGATLVTLPFPTMTPIFGKRPLTTGERQNLEAFFRQQTGSPGPNSASKIIFPAIGGFIVLVTLIWVIWKRRLTTVRRALVRSGGVRS